LSEKLTQNAMQCPLCESNQFQDHGKTANGDRKYLCEICHESFLGEAGETFCLPQINFLRFKDKRLVQRTGAYVERQVIKLVNLISGKNETKVASNTWLTEIIAIIFLWCISCYISQPVFDRPLDLNAHHEWLMVHSLINLRAFEQWGFGNLLGASVLIPKSIEYIQADITNLNKADGIYLSYPTLWLAIPYLIFKVLSIPINNFNLQVYHLIFNRLIISIVIYYLFLEIIRLLGKTNFFQGLGSRILALISTAGWMFNPPVLYWMQNVYFCDQAVLLPVYALLLFTLKQNFCFEYLSLNRRVFLFFLSLLAAGFDWYGWVVLFLIILIIILPLASKNIKVTIYAIQPIIAAIGLISIWFVVQLFYYKDGWNQIRMTFFDRIGKDIPLDLAADLKTIVSYWSNYFPNPIKLVMLKEKISLEMILVTLFTVLIALLFLLWISHKHDRRKLLLVCVLLIFAPLLQLILLRGHSTAHDFSALKLALPTAFIFWIVIPFIGLNILNSLSYITIARKVFSPWILISGLIIIRVLISNDIQPQFLQFAWQGDPSPRELGEITKKYIAVNDLPISDSDGIHIKAFPPQPVWHTNRFIYTTEEISHLSKKLNVPTLKHLNPVFISYEDEANSQAISSICMGVWQPINETILNRKIRLCRHPKLRELL
jgi:hypothetical protein